MTPEMEMMEMVPSNCASVLIPCHDFFTFIMEMEQDETMEFLTQRVVVTRCRFAAYLLVHGCSDISLAHKVLAKLHDYGTETRWQFHLPFFASHMISYVFQFQANQHM